MSAASSDAPTSNGVRGETETISSVEALTAAFEDSAYVLDRALATTVYLLIKLGKPLLIEGHAGVGKTDVAKVLASLLGTELIRLQCYEGLDINSAVYEWNYQRQLLVINMQRGASDVEQEKRIFGPDFLEERPLLHAIRAERRAPVLLIDEIDRADEAFEAFLLELLSDFQITIPELGTIKAQHRPFVILTSNRTRELSDALKRRCLYHWIDYPDLEKELKIVRIKLPAIESKLAKQAVRLVHALRTRKLTKSPGVAETLDFVQSLELLGTEHLDETTAEQVLGCVVKSADDFARIKSEGIGQLLEH